ncbi:MAG: sugar ABC transporter substrate-binding protein [Firmicutes bacterium]|nr:sugar ABC transporter substrate-binding protein [Bacillota bacterium]
MRVSLQLPSAVRITIGMVMAFLLLVNHAPAALGAEKTKLEFWSWDQKAHDLEVSLATRYMRRNPHVEVEVVTEPWASYWDKMTILNATGTPPDVYYMSVAYNWDYANVDWTQSMEQFARQLPQQNYFWPVMNDLRYPNRSGELYAFPFDWVASLLFFNRSMFDENGVAHPNNSWDWFTLRDAAKKLTRDTDGDGHPDIWGFISNTSHELLDSVIYSWGGGVLDSTQRQSRLCDPESLEAIQFMVDLIHKDRVSAPLGTSPSFVSGRVGMYIGICTLIESLHDTKAGFDWDVAMVPKGPQSRVIYGGPNSIVVSKMTAHPEIAFDFARFFVTEREATEIRKGRIPVYVPLARNPQWLTWNNPPANMRVVLESSQFVQGADFGTTKWNEWRSVAMNNALAPAYRGQISVAAAAQNAAQVINQILASTTCRRCP